MEASLDCYAQGLRPQGADERAAPVAALERDKAQMEEAIRGAEADVTSAKSRYERVRALLESHDATVAQLDAAQQRLDRAEQKLAAYRAEVLYMEQQVTNTETGTGAQGIRDTPPPLTRPESALNIKIASLERQKSQTQAALKDTEVGVSTAKGRYQRVRALVESHDATVSQLNAAREGLEGVRQQLAAQRAKLAALDHQLSLARAEQKGIQLPEHSTQGPEPLSTQVVTLEKKKAQAQHAIKAAETRLAAARSHYERIEQLFNNRDTTQDQLELAKQKLILAKTELLDAKTALSNIEGELAGAHLGLDHDNSFEQDKE